MEVNANCLRYRDPNRYNGKRHGPEKGEAIAR